MKGILALALLLAPACAIAAPRAQDPDWPCQSIKLPELSYGSFWTGAPLDSLLESWRGDTQVAALASEITARRMPLDEAQSAIAAFAGAAGGKRAERLALLMAGVFSILSQERHEVMEGLDRFGRNQKDAAAAVRKASADLADAQQAGSVDPARLEALNQAFTWSTRIFEQRRQSIQYACAVPATIEQRLYALAQLIQQALPPQ
jgi:hypothetical protein